MESLNLVGYLYLYLEPLLCKFGAETETRAGEVHHPVTDNTEARFQLCRRRVPRTAHLGTPSYDSSSVPAPTIRGDRRYSDQLSVAIGAWLQLRR